MGDVHRVNDLAYTTAADLVAAIQTGNLTAEALMAFTYQRIDSLNPAVNALVNVLPQEQALALARAADERRAEGQGGGLLDGLPVVVKDLLDAEGFPTTFGFVPFKNRVARRDSAVAARQKAAGAIVIGKSNTPEFGFGSHTFNRVFGVTRNPWDLERSAGGSSGGAAAALAAGLVAVADGSDFGGSLRNPAGFCNVVGFRPSVGRVGSEVRPMGWLGRIATEGPMARSVADVARLLTVLAEPDPKDPLALGAGADVFHEGLARDVAGLRVAVSADLGFLPVEPAVREVFEGVPGLFEQLGCKVELTCPDLHDAMESFQTMRAANVAFTARWLEREVPHWRSHAKETAIWNFERGLALRAEELLHAEAVRTQCYRRCVAFFQRFDALVLPAAQVLPFPVETEWVTEIDGVPMDTYLDWMTVCCVISLTGLPALAMPAGFSAAGLPVGLQLVGPPRSDREVLQLGFACGSGDRLNAATTPLDAALADTASAYKLAEDAAGGEGS